MKKQTLLILSALTVLSMLLSACDAAQTAESQARVGSKVDASQVAFTGVVEDITDTTITVDGQIVSAPADLLTNANFRVGDTVEVTASVDSTGAVIAAEVELYVESVDMTGVIDSIDGTTVTVDGQIFDLGAQAGLLDGLAAGDTVQIEYTVNADNTMTVTEIQLDDDGASDADLSDDSISADDASDDESADDNATVIQSDNSGGVGHNDGNHSDDHEDDDDGGDDD